MILKNGGRMHWLEILRRLRKEQNKIREEQPRLELPLPVYEPEDLPQFEDHSPELERGVVIIDYST